MINTIVNVKNSMSYQSIQIDNGSLFNFIHFNKHVLNIGIIGSEIKFFKL